MEESCIFCQIAKGDKDASIIYQDESFIVFHDINPKAPKHVLIVPKKHIASINHLKEEDEELMGKMLLLVQKVAIETGVKEKGYKLVFNVGRGGGQVIDHIHLHLLGGWQSQEERDIPGMP